MRPQSTKHPGVVGVFLSLLGSPGGVVCFTFIRFTSLTSAVGGVVGVVVGGAVCLFLPLLGSPLSRLVGVWGLL